MKDFKSMYYFAEEESKTDETTLILIGRGFFLTGSKMSALAAGNVALVYGLVVNMQ